MGTEREGNSGVQIHPTAVVHPTAELDHNVEIGPYTVIGESVNIGANTKIGSHAVIDKWTTIGKECHIFQFVSIGAPPQDLGYQGEKTEVILGDNNVIREFVTIHRATTKESLKTVCGSNNLFMNYVHIAHDCLLGDNIIMANNATLAGHVTIADHAIVGGIVAVHQHVRIGPYCIIGGASAVSMDIPPYVLAVGNRATVRSLNMIGIRRKGFTATDIKEIKRCYSILFKSSLGKSGAAEMMKAEMPDSIHARRFLEAIEASERGIARLRHKKKSDTQDEEED
jgi:UDP-N-acetylglucosamine acyltransferase